MRIKKIISCVLCAALLLTFLPAPAHAVTLTAINDSILPLDESTMPARLGGETYVPYSVFTTLGVSASENDGVLDLSFAETASQMAKRSAFRLRKAMCTIRI